MSVHVFLGPSVPIQQARRILDAEYHPPVSLGDVCELVLDCAPTTMIAIVDGQFEQVPTVWHKEILYALSRGVWVFGASSMGAIRAAELQPFGMVGVGEIFRRFSTGEFEDDDEVAIVHATAEHGYQPLSEAMANLRLGLESATAKGAISARTAAELTAGAKAMFYPDRSWSSLFEYGRRQGLPASELDALRNYVQREAPDAKRADAVALLMQLASLLVDDVSPFQPEFMFEPTYNWEKLANIVRNRRHSVKFSDGVGIDAQTARDAIIRARPDLVRMALSDYLVQREAQRLGLLVPGMRDEVDGLGRSVVPMCSHIDQLYDAFERRHRNDTYQYLLARLERAGAVDKISQWLSGDNDAEQTGVLD